MKVKLDADSEDRDDSPFLILSQGKTTRVEFYLHVIGANLPGLCDGPEETIGAYPLVLSKLGQSGISSVWMSQR